MCGCVFVRVCACVHVGGWAGCVNVRFKHAVAVNTRRENYSNQLLSPRHTPTINMYHQCGHVTHVAARSVPANEEYSITACSAYGHDSERTCQRVALRASERE